MIEINDRQEHELGVGDLQFPMVVTMPGHQYFRVYDRESLDKLNSITLKAIQILDTPTEV